MRINSFEKQAKNDEFKDFMNNHYPIITDEKSTEYDDEDSSFDQDGQNK